MQNIQLPPQVTANIRYVESAYIKYLKFCEEQNIKPIICELPDFPIRVPIELPLQEVSTSISTSATATGTLYKLG